MTDTATTDAKETKKEATITTVTMSDARVVDFPGKRKLLKEPLVSADGTVAVRFDFINGQTRLFTIPPALMAKFAAHGASQKIGDETAGLADIDDQVLAVDELIDRLYNGDWGVKRDGSGLAGTSVLLRALVELTGKTVEDVKTFLKAKTQAEKVALRNSAKVKPIVERIEAEKVSKAGNVDTDALLSELS